MSNSNNRVNHAVRRALFFSALATSVGAPVMAQDQAQQGAAPAVTEVVVTGSRIQSPNLVSISPVSTVSASDIQATGLTRAEDILNNLPMVFAAQNSTVSNGADGTATINLRGLGPQRSVVLVNGRRLGPGFGDGRNFSDINQIPAALIDRIDIETGGASAVYGADAVAGVVNFVLNTKFQGVRIDADYNFFQHHNGNTGAQSYVKAHNYPLPDSSVNTGFGKSVSILMGSNFADDRGNATFYATFDKANATLQSKFDYSSCSLAANSKGGLSCGGSGTTAKNGAGGYFLAYGVDGKPLFSSTVDGLTGQFRDFDANNDRYNFGPLNFYQRPNERWTAGTFLTLDVNSHATVYGEAMFSRNTSEAQIAASGDFTLLSFIPCSDPLLTAQEHDVICSKANIAAQTPTKGPNAGIAPTGINMYIGRRNVEGGGRVATFSNQSFRTLVGVRGDINDAFKYDAYAQRGSVDSSNGNVNYFSNANIQNALTVVPDPTTGAPVCQSVLNGTDTACVPWNIWVPNGVTKEALNYLQVPLLIEATTTEQVVSGSITGDLGKYGVKVPSNEEGLKVNLGAEWRSESANFLPDLLSQQGNAAGSGGPTTPVHGNYHVKELFSEFRVPILDKAPFADSMSFEGGYRWSDYSLGFKTNTYKLGLEWAPIQDIRARASYQRAVRAPNILELYTPAAVVLDGSQDPCAGPTPVASAAQCALTGVSAAQYGNIAASPAGQYNGNLGGNTKLHPEKSDTYSAGVVFQPSFIEHLMISVDYFNIKVQDTIGAIGADTIINNCLATGDPVYCTAVRRDQNGTLFRTPQGYIDDTNVNFGSLSTKGIDFKSTYRIGLTSLGSVNLDLEGTKLIALSTQPLTNGPTYNCVGFFGTTCGASNPSWRHTFTTTWSTPWDALDVTFRWRFIGSVDSQLTSSDPQLTGKSLPLTSHIGTYNYLDLTARFAVYKGVSLQLGVNNIADKDPPILNSSGGGYASNCPTITPNGSSCNGNTWPGTYDAMGRFLFARVTAQF